MPYGVDFIETHIDNDMEDLDTLFKHDHLLIDLEYYNELVSILGSAKDAVKTAAAAYEKRKNNRNQHGTKNELGEERSQSRTPTFSRPYGE